MPTGAAELSYRVKRAIKVKVQGEDLDKGSKVIPCHSVPRGLTLALSDPYNTLPVVIVLAKFSQKRQSINLC